MANVCILSNYTMKLHLTLKGPVIKCPREAFFLHGICWICWICWCSDIFNGGGSYVDIYADVNSKNWLKTLTFLV